MGVFGKIFSNLAAEGGPLGTLVIDATHLKAPRTACSLLKGGGLPRHIGRTKAEDAGRDRTLVNKMTRTIWAILTNEEDYRDLAKAVTV